MENYNFENRNFWRIVIFRIISRYEIALFKKIAIWNCNFQEKCDLKLQFSEKLQYEIALFRIIAISEIALFKKIALWNCNFQENALYKRNFFGKNCAFCTKSALLEPKAQLFCCKIALYFLQGADGWDVPTSAGVDDTNWFLATEFRHRYTFDFPNT